MGFYRCHMMQLSSLFTLCDGIKTQETQDWENLGHDARGGWCVGALGFKRSVLALNRCLRPSSQGVRVSTPLTNENRQRRLTAL